MRINKFISHNSGHSRREADELVRSGLVKINGQPAGPGAEVGEKDRVMIRGQALRRRGKFSLIIYHKIKGELVSRHDPRGRRLVYEALPKGFAGWRCVGRLDFASEGLLLLCDSPAVAEALMSSDLEREYYLKIRGQVSERVIEAMRTGLEITGTKGAHAKTKIAHMRIAPFVDFELFGSSGGYTKLRVLISQGQNRELRRFFGFFDLEVVDLKRVGFGVLNLGGIKPGKYRFLTGGEYEKLREFLKMKGVRW